MGGVTSLPAVRYQTACRYAMTYAAGHAGRHRDALNCPMHPNQVPRGPSQHPTSSHPTGSLAISPERFLDRKERKASHAALLGSTATMKARQAA